MTSGHSRRARWLGLAAMLALLVPAACGGTSGGLYSSPATPSPAPSGPLANPSLHLAAGDLAITRGSSRLLALRVQLAQTEAERDTGLMHVTSLPDGAGMAFLFGATTTTSFYMKDTLLPLDIAFWDATGAIITTYTMQPCTADPCRLYDAQDGYVGAVEMRAGLLASSGVATGDTVTLSR